HADVIVKWVANKDLMACREVLGSFFYRIPNTRSGGGANTRVTRLETPCSIEPRSKEHPTNSHPSSTHRSNESPGRSGYSFCKEDFPTRQSMRTVDGTVNAIVPFLGLTVSGPAERWKCASSGSSHFSSEK